MALNAVLVAAVIAIPVMLFIGAWSDKVGRKKLYLGGIIAIALYIYPFLYLVNLMNTVALFVAIIVGFSFIWSIYGALMGTFLAESFTADVRYTGCSLGYQVGAALVGGPAPLIATALLAGMGNYIGVGLFVIACGVVSFIAVALAPDRSGQPLD